MDHKYTIKTLPEILKDDVSEPFEAEELEKLALDHTQEKRPEFQNGGLFGDYACLTYQNGDLHRFLFSKKGNFYYLDMVGVIDEKTKQEKLYTIEEYFNLENKSF